MSDYLNNYYLNQTKRGVKTSDFVRVTNVPAGSLLELIAEKQNLTITYEDFLANLGVTGTITDTPLPDYAVLDQQGNTNVIRGLVAGNGINLTQDVNGNIVISLV